MKQQMPEAEGVHSDERLLPDAGDLDAIKSSLKLALLLGVPEGRFAKGMTASQMVSARNVLANLTVWLANWQKLASIAEDRILASQSDNVARLADYRSTRISSAD